MELKYTIAAVLIAAALLIVGIAVVAPEHFEKIPVIGDTVHAVYYANVEYDVRTPDWIWESMSVKIVNVTIEKKIIPLSIGPLWFWPETYRGKVVIESVRGSYLIDRVERDVEVTEGWFGFQGSKRLTDRVKLGLEGSGTYTIRLKLYNKDGKIISEDSTTRTV